MKLPLTLLALVLALLACFGYAMWRAPDEAISHEHPTIDSMESGRAQAAFDAEIHQLGLAMAFLASLTALTLLLFAADGSRSVQTGLCLATVPLLIVLGLIAGQPPATEAGESYPAGTLWLLFGLLTAPLGYVLVYALSFDRLSDRVVAPRPKAAPGREEGS